MVVVHHHQRTLGRTEGKQVDLLHFWPDADGINIGLCTRRLRTCHDVSGWVFRDEEGQLRRRGSTRMLACRHFLKLFDRRSCVYLTATHPPNLPETLQQQRPLLPQLPPTNLHGDRGRVLDDGDTNHLLLLRQPRDNLLQEDEGLVEVDLPDRFRALYDE